MGMYTELILGCSLKENTPNEVIEVLKFMCGQTEEKPLNFPFKDGSRIEWMLRGGSAYFPCNHCEFSLGEFYKNTWTLNTRSNIKNYSLEIQEFLEWLKPYVYGGSGINNMYAIVMYEEDEKPKMYYK